ncbi:MAG TPA: hypothetical protein VFT48_16025 [Pyrinomonadaceae bacterium]|nr:hypothetical protein [Pyrinomonadaceae bacterium]
MKEDYLWDKTGEPDPQIQQLEEILGTLRYQPKPLEIPEELPLPQRRTYAPWLAIAAGVLLAILAGGIWLSTRSRGEAPQHEVKVAPPAPVKEVTPSPTGTTDPPKTPEQKPDSRKEVIAINRHRPKVSTPVLSKREREEALMAKEQVMLALRVTTEKLSLVHKKTQNTNPANQIKNQHRVG